MGRQVFVFNDQFELAFAYPNADDQHEGVGDFSLVDFQGDGELQLCVGFWGVLGVHGIDLQGQRKWSNRAAASVVSLAPTPPLTPAPTPAPLGSTAPAPAPAVDDVGLTLLNSTEFSWNH